MGFGIRATDHRTPGSPHIPQRWRGEQLPAPAQQDRPAQTDPGQTVPDAQGDKMHSPRRIDRAWRGGWHSIRAHLLHLYPSIMRIVIALSQAWYIDSNMHKYHTNHLLHIVIVNYSLSIDIPPY